MENITERFEKRNKVIKDFNFINERPDDMSQKIYKEHLRVQKRLIDLYSIKKIQYSSNFFANNRGYNLHHN